MIIITIKHPIEVHPRCFQHPKSEKERSTSNPHACHLAAVVCPTAHEHRERMAALQPQKPKPGAGCENYMLLVVAQNFVGEWGAKIKCRV